MAAMFSTPSPPPMPGSPPPPPDQADLALRNAKLQERRRQLGLQGRMTTFLTGSQGDTSAPPSPMKTLLGA